LTSEIRLTSGHDNQSEVADYPRDRAIDVIVPVYNSPEWNRACLRSILRNTDLPYRLIIVDDASDSYTRNQLTGLVAEHRASLLISNEQNLGFVKSCNVGIGASDSRYLVLLNSDAVVPPGWLDRLVRCVESDSRIGIVNPLSNEAANISVPLAPGCNFLGMAEALAQNNIPSYPDIVTAVGFCLLLRRRMLEEIGVFDEIYGFGYCEETDLSLRAMKAGWRVVACDDLYVFHRGGATFTDGGERYRNNIKILLARHGEAYRSAYRQFVKDAPLRELCARVREEAPPGWRRWLSTGKVVATDLVGIHPRRAWRHFKERRLTDEFHKSAARYQNFWRPNKPSVTFLFESTGSYGGVISVLRLVNGLIEKGFEVRIACLNAGPGLIRGLYTKPLCFGSVANLISGVANSDVFISTFWLTAYWLPKIRERFPQTRLVSYVQDFESWFESDSSVWAEKVIASYEIPDAIVTTSDWLKTKLRERGRDSHVIPKGVDRDIFRVLKDDTRDQAGVVGMARPHTPYRGFHNLVKIFRRLHEREPRVNLSFFGCKDKALGKLDFPARSCGVVENGMPLVKIYNRNTVFVDPSKFQGFGMMGLEAMASGCATVLTREGGINEYAKDQDNSLLFDPNDSEAAANLILDLLNDDSKRAHLVKKGLETAAAFSLQREIDSFATFLRSECEWIRAAGPTLSKKVRGSSS